MPNSTDYQSCVATSTASIANASTTSDAIDLSGTTLCGIHMPAAFTGTSLTFQAAPTLTGTYQTIQKSGADLSVTVAASKYVGLTPADFAGVQFLKIVSSASEAAARSLILALRPV